MVDCADGHTPVVYGDLVLPVAAHYDEVLAVLDRLEGYAPGGPASQNLYERVVVQAHRPDGTTVRAWVYLAAGPLAARLRATGTPVPGGDWLGRAPEADADLRRTTARALPPVPRRP